MEFKYTKSKVANRGEPPDWFLEQLVIWGHSAPADIFEVKLNKTHPGDVFNLLAPILGPWTSPLHRRCGLLELMRVHAGLESSWKQHEGKDPGNHNPDPKSWETGLFQVSFDSTEILKGVMKPFAIAHGINDVNSFIDKMKEDVELAFEYYARLVRWNYQWAGPLKRHEVDEWLSRPSVVELQSLLI
jgi:hypothetical protein